MTVDSARAYFARGNSLLRRLRSTAGRFMRKHGLLPGGMPDGLGDDEALRGLRLPYEVMVFFADTPPSLYQMEQWYESFRALNEVHSVGVFVRDSRVAAAIRRDSKLPTHTIADMTTIDDILTRAPTRLCLYVNHNPENFANLKFGRLVHASMMHGDSDKTVTVSNQTKGYDFSFVAGQAAIDRMRANTMFYDAEARCIPIGRPQTERQLARLAEFAASRRADSPTTVLYAPSWEDAQASSAYGTVESHGPRLVKALLDDGTYRVIYRPHPLTGVRVPSYGEADGRIRALIAAAATARPDLAHRVDVGNDLAESFAESDIMICDISGVAIDWLPSGKPLIITIPAGEHIRGAQTKLTRLVPRLAVQDLGGAVALVKQTLAQDATRTERAQLTEYYLGDTSPGASNRKFVEACERIMDLRDAEIARIDGRS